ncbi:hypothetical protein J6P92_01245, partial [bacterium]|nr:hypothetical protein [bacterium]
ANINERVNSERQANIAQKITQAMEQMRAHGLLNTQYQSTDAFVDELQKYLKIAKRCDSEHIADCWPTDKVTMSDGEELEVSKAKTGANLSLSTETNNVGLILADGASIILNYNPATDPIDVGDKVVSIPSEGKSLPVGNGKSKLFPYTTTVTNGVDFVMDVNGGKKPNSEVAGRARDIRSFKIAQFSEGGPDCSIYPNGFYVEDVGCVVNLGVSAHYNNAKEQCTGINMKLPEKSMLYSICYKRNDNSNIPSEGRFWAFSTFASDYAPFLQFEGVCYEGSDSGSSSSYGVICVE